MLLHFVAFLFSVLVFLAIRLAYLLSQSNRSRSHANKSKTAATRRTKPAATMIILGSGGHTAEMLAITQRLNRKLYSPRVYVVAKTDRTSASKAVEQEMALGATDYMVMEIPRSREVRQSFATALFTTLRALAGCLPIVCTVQPDLVLCNGPGTCVPIVAMVYLAKIMFINAASKVVFVESFCRVRSISLTGNLLLWMTDLFVVQWPEIESASRGIRYLGKLM